MKCVVWAGEWETEKTRTYEMAIGTKHGIMSLKVVEHRGRRTVDVFSGFDPIHNGTVAGDTMEYGIETDLPLASIPEFWEHRYIESISKSATKWGGQHKQCDPCDLSDALRHMSPHYLDKADEFVCAGGGMTHWKMLHGQIPGESSSPRNAAKSVERQQLKAARQASAQSQFDKCIAEDELFGIF